MGCSGSTAATTGIVLPEQELAITNSELLHPFSNTPVDDLFKAFSNFGLDGPLKEPLFHAACRVLGVHTEKWHQVCEAYLAALRLPSGDLDLHTLLLTVVLLGTGDYPAKARLAVSLYTSAELSCSQARALLEDLMFTATAILPQMCKHEEAKLEQYLGRLAAVQSTLVDSLLTKLVSTAPIGVEELVRNLEVHADLRKLWWANGIRLMLIEEDIERSALKIGDHRDGKEALSHEASYVTATTRNSSPLSKPEPQPQRLCPCGP